MASEKVPLLILAAGVRKSEWKAAARTGKHLILHGRARRWKSRAEDRRRQRAPGAVALTFE
jgi:hypothetical protein